MGTRLVQLSKLAAVGLLNLSLLSTYIAPVQAAEDPLPAAAQADSASAEKNAEVEYQYPTEEENAVGLASATQPTPPPADGAPAAPPALPETEVVAQPQAGPAPTNNYNEVTGPSILQGTVFQSAPVNGYNANSSTVGTLVDVPDRIFPGSISTVTRDVLRDQQILTMDELLRDVPSAVKSYGADGVIRQDQFFIRGFEVTSQNWRKDGYLDPTYMPRDPANMQRVDVLAGPASVLYGAAQPAGTWNVTTKQAQADAFAYGSFMTGSYGLQRYTVDVNTPLNKDGTVLFRLNAAYQNGNSNVQSVFTERTFVAPTLTFVLDEDTSFVWSGEYQKDRFRLYQGIPAINGDPFAINRNTFTGNPNGDLADYTSYRNTMTLTRILNDDWTVKVGEMSLWYNTPSTTTLLDNGTLNSAGLLSSPVFGQDQSVASPFVEQNHDVMEVLNGEFDTWSLKHNMVLGAEQDWFITNHDTFTTTSTTNLFTGTSGSAFGPVNVAGGGPFPLVGPTNNPPGAAFTQNVFDNPSFRQNRFGFFGQDVIDVTDRLHILGGARFDYMNQEYARSDTTIIPAAGGIVNVIGPTHTFDTFNRFSPRTGLTYDLIPDTMSVYAMYSKSFSPSVGVANFSPPTPLLPEIGDIWEGGIKTQLSKTFQLRTSGYWIRQHNVNVEQFNPTPGAALPIFLTQAGLQRSQGVEANLTGNITERLSTISNVSYNDSYLYGVAQASPGSTAPIAQTRVRGVPHWLGNLWARYNFIQEQQRQVGMALGMRYVGNRVGDYSSPLVLPSYNVWDLGFFYNRGNVNGMILWDNIFNINYAVSSLSQYQVIQGTPSNVRLQFSYMY